MRPKTISASSLANAQDCFAKFEAVNIDFVPEVGKKGASKVGTAFHYAAQHLVRLVYLEKTHQWDLDLALELYDEGYISTFLTADTDTTEYADGRQLVIDWFGRTDLSAYEILSVEEKRRIPIPSAAYDKSKGAHEQPNKNAAVVPLSYIWDLCYKKTDEVTAEKLLVVRDYKTIQKAPRPDELGEKIQLRIYAMCAFIYFKDERPDKIRCEIDLIRHGMVMGRTFTRDEIVGFWSDTRKELQRILDTEKITRAHYTLGPGCRFCPIAPSCPARKKNIRASSENGGGIMSLSFEDQLQMRAEIQAQNDANKQLLEEVNAQIAAEAVARDELEFDVGNWAVEVALKGQRKPDQARFREAMGEKLWLEHGAPMSMAKYDALMKSDVLPDDVREKMPHCFEQVLNKNVSITVTPKRTGE